MQRALITAAFVSCALIVPLARGQSLPTKSEAKELVRKTIEDMRLRSPERPPFHLTANIHFEVKDKAVDGTYELLWAAPDRYREEFKMGSIAETDFGLEDKLYIVRTTPALPLPLWRVRNLLFSPTGDPMDSPRVRTVERVEGSPNNEVCVEANYNVVGRERFCFNSAANEILSIKAGDPDGKAPMRDVRRELGDFFQLGAIRFPRHLFYDDAGEQLDVLIKSLDQAPNFSESTFIPPSTAAERDGCSNPTQSDATAWLHRPTMTLNKSVAVPAYAVLVGRDGRVEKVSPAVSGGDGFDRTMGNFLHTAPFPIKFCGGRPIQYEEIVFPAILVPSHLAP
jgi:hypothetical protein